MEVVEVGPAAEVAPDPAVGRLHRNADAVVLAHEQHRCRQAPGGGPRRGIERGLRGGMVAGRVAEGADRDAVGRHRQLVADAPCLFDRHRRTQRLRQVRGDGRGLWQHPQRLAAPDLVPATGRRILGAGGKAERRIHHRVHPRKLAEAFGHETAGAVVQERRIGVPGQPRDHRVALVAAAADGVEDLVLHAQNARHQVEVAADELRFEQLAEAACVQRAARQDRVAVTRPWRRRSGPGTDELAEVAVADFGAVDAAPPGAGMAGVFIGSSCSSCSSCSIC